MYIKNYGLRILIVVKLEVPLLLFFVKRARTSCGKNGELLCSCMILLARIGEKMYDDFKHITINFDIVDFKTGYNLREIDRKLDEILEKLSVSKVDNIFLVGLSILSILFGLSNLVLTDLSHRQILMIGAVIYFLFSFYIGYLRGSLRDNWGFRILGWVSLSLSTGVILVSLIMLVMFEAKLQISPLLPIGLILLSESTSTYLLTTFIKDMSTVIPNFEHHISSIPPVIKRYMSPFVDPCLRPHRSKSIYAAILAFFIAGAILTICGTR